VEGGHNILFLLKQVDIACPFSPFISLKVDSFLHFLRKRDGWLNHANRLDRYFPPRVVK
jgi:hypothetical protein